ncbi:hypothetical protein SG34_006210 [Thalassomonas viridans]|uniref:Uncharacterized protein n=1 Tax=Thalassomonas viridans TaxID=137584 RepID=A0AAF0CAN5_9GAMM|nr:hypothetical protein [Thalassomonas viridans]WDE06510.1 hypothetical protein SG34_006210 [Thalassomonas viridans]
MNTIASFFQALSQLPVMESIMVILPLIGTFVAALALTFMSKHLYARVAFALLSLGILITAPFSANFQVSTLAQTEHTRQDAIKYQDSLQRHFNLLTGDAKSRDEAVNSRLMEKFNRLDTRQKEVVELIAEVVADANKQLLSRLEQQTLIIDDLIADSEGYLSDKVSSASVDVIGHVTVKQSSPGNDSKSVNRELSALLGKQTDALNRSIAHLSDRFTADLNKEMARQDEHYQQFSRDLARVSSEIKQINRMLAAHQTTQVLSLEKGKDNSAVVAAGLSGKRAE